MPGSPRSFRAHACRTSWWVGLLLVLIGLAGLSLDTVSFGHEHLAVAGATYHHHVFFGSHDHHSGEEPGHDHDHDHGEGDDHEAPAPDPHDHHGTRRTATVSLSPALFQPVVAGALILPEMTPVPVRLIPVQRSATRFAALSISPRGPPVRCGAPGSGAQEGGSA